MKPGEWADYFAQNYFQTPSQESSRSAVPTLAPLSVPQAPDYGAGGTAGPMASDDPFYRGLMQQAYDRIATDTANAAADKRQTDLESFYKTIYNQGTGNWSSEGGGLAKYGFSQLDQAGTLKAKGSAKYGFQAPMWDALSKANADMKAAGLGTFTVTSGWRDYNWQKNKYAKDPSSGMVAPPGKSVHHLGLAADLGLSPAQYRWLLKNGKAYGLVNLPSETWHWQLSAPAWTQWKNYQTQRRRNMTTGADTHHYTPW